MAQESKPFPRFLFLSHGLIFSIASAICIYVRTESIIAYIPPGAILSSSIFSIFLFLIFASVFYLITRDLSMTGLTSTILILGVLYFFDIFLLIIIVTLLSLVIIRLVLKRSIPNLIHILLNTISVSLLLFYGVTYLGYFHIDPVPIEEMVTPLGDLPPKSTSLNSTPDIYYLILDGYGSTEMLQTEESFDNTPFQQALQSRGFYVVPDGLTNYPRTLLSLASSLNSQYLDRLSSRMGISGLWWPTMDTIQHSEIRRLLETQGYQTVFLGASWDFVDIRNGDAYIKQFPLMLTEFERLYLNQTNLRILYPVINKYITTSSYESHRQMILKSFDQIPSIAKIPGPKFVFGHIIAVHPPYIFDETGNSITPDYPFYMGDPFQFGTQKIRFHYLNQLKYINQLTIDMVDEIIQNSITSPLIILQGDHGPGISFGFDSINGGCLYERYAILNALRLPGIEPIQIPPDLSPVNTFRVIFNLYFNSNFEILPNNQYYSTPDNFYQFTDVTNIVHDSCVLP